MPELEPIPPNSLQRVCVFCGSHPGSRPDYANAARTVGELLARENITLVYGAGNVGLMGAVAESCLNAGGSVIGVIPEQLVHRELAHLGLTELHVVDSMHTRKAMMADLAGAFLALPGGIGTFEELFEIWTWSQLGLQNKAVGLLNVAGYYDHLIALANHAAAEGFLGQRARDLLVVETDPRKLLEALRQARPASAAAPIGKEAR